MSVKLTPARLRQIVMEESAAMRGETKNFRLTESQLRQIIRQELNEALDSWDARKPPAKIFEGCKFVITDTGLAVEVLDDEGEPYASTVLLEPILRALGAHIGTMGANVNPTVSQEELETALDLKVSMGTRGSGPIARKTFLIAEALDEVCPNSTYEGKKLEWTHADWAKVDPDNMMTWKPPRN